MNCALGTTNDFLVAIFLLLSGAFGMLHGMGDFFKLAQFQLFFGAARVSLAISLMVYALSVVAVLIALKFLALYAILLLFVLSAFHFGDTEQKTLQFRKKDHRLSVFTAFALGAPVILLPLLFQAACCHQIFCWLGISDFPFGYLASWCEAALLLACTCLNLWQVNCYSRENRMRILLGVFYYYCLIFAHPLLSFSCFFVFRHSVDEIKAMLEEGVIDLPHFINFWRVLPLFSAVVIIFAVLYFPLVIDTDRFEGAQVALVFSILLALTPAHLAVGLLFERQSRAQKKVLINHCARQC